MTTGDKRMERTAAEMPALELARQRLRDLQPREVAYRSGAHYREASGGEGKGVLHVPLLGRVYAVDWASGAVATLDDGSEPRPPLALLVIHYLLHADGHPMADRWVTFRELPNGLMYDTALRGRVEPPLMATFGREPERLDSVARKLGGVPIAIGDVAYAFDALPRVRLAVAVYRGDEELPPAVRLLYDAAAGHYLPTEDLAVLGGLLVGRLVAGARAR